MVVGFNFKLILKIIYLGDITTIIKQIIRNIWFVYGYYDIMLIKNETSVYKKTFN